MLQIGAEPSVLPAFLWSAGSEEGHPTMCLHWTKDDLLQQVLRLEEFVIDTERPRRMLHISVRLPRPRMA